MTDQNKHADNTDNLVSDPIEEIDNQSADHDEKVLANALKATPKRGRTMAALGLLVAVVALITVGWLYYRLEFQKNEPSSSQQLSSKADQQDLDSLQSRVDRLARQLSEQQQSIQENRENLKRLQQGLDNLPDARFDSGPLEQQISRLQQQINSLKDQTGSAISEPQTASYLSALVRAQTIEALKMVQLLLDQQQITQAVQVLKQWRNNEHLPMAVLTRIQQLITTLSNTEKPDVNRLRQQLNMVRERLADVKLTTEKPQSEKPAWYERFITVQKIKPEQQALNSADLLQLKANVGYFIDQAELALTLKQPDGWRENLHQAEQTLTNTALETKALVQQIQQLKAQKITTQIPQGLGIDALIQQLEGLTE
ncbi:MAG: hypothetical protein ACK5L8_02045 [Marinicella pacifica]